MKALVLERQGKSASSITIALFLTMVRYKHPYALEIEQSSFPPSTYQMAPAVPFTSPDDSAVIFVDTEEGVQRMLEELKNAKEIAIDLEHNDRRSYVGLVCLMQISTREKDWIVDTLKPWRENLQILNDVFADPNILKVFHGSSMDMIWLQRDLGLYVVGLFDTYHACCALQFPGKSLKYLLQRFANFQAQKQYQTADWRVRPLPAELIDYARSDTHYLLYIYDQLRNMLLEASTPGDNLIDRVLRGSKGEALQVYERPIYDRDRGLGAFGWFDLLMQRSVKFDNEQFGVFRAVHEWRDKKARDWDEGLQYVMSNSALWSIAENMPTYSGGLHNCVRPMPKPVADNAKELIEVIKQGKIDGRNGPSVHEVMLQNEEIYSAGRRYRRIQKKESDSTYQGVGAILQQLTESGEVQLGQNLATTALNVSNGEPVATRSVSSHFWGAVMPLQESPFPSDDTAALDALGSVLPLPTLSAASFCEAGTLPSPPPTRVKASEPAPANPVPGVTSSVQGDGDDVFILKELSHIKKRKAEDEDDDVPVGWPPTNGMDHPNTTESGDAALDPTIAARKLAKQQKKAEKRAKKEAAKVEAAAIAAQPVVPFDYASAESLLHSIGDQSVNEDGGQGVKRMNPFAKALDTSTGARRPKMGQELAGKTATFKS